MTTDDRPLTLSRPRHDFRIRLAQPSFFVSVFGQFSRDFTLVFPSCAKRNHSNGRRAGAEPRAIHFLEALPEVTLLRSVLRAWSISLELSYGVTPWSAALGAVHAH